MVCFIYLFAVASWVLKPSIVMTLTGISKRLPLPFHWPILGMGYAPYFNRTFAYETYYYGISFYEIYFYGSIFYEENMQAPNKFF
jgi:hypothetical protein